MGNDSGLWQKKKVKKVLLNYSSWYRTQHSPAIDWKFTTMHFDCDRACFFWAYCVCWALEIKTLKYTDMRDIVQRVLTAPINIRNNRITNKPGCLLTIPMWLAKKTNKKLTKWQHTPNNLQKSSILAPAWAVKICEPKRHRVSGGNADRNTQQGIKTEGLRTGNTSSHWGVRIPGISLF